MYKSTKKTILYDNQWLYELINENKTNDIKGGRSNLLINQSVYHYINYYEIDWIQYT